MPPPSFATPDLLDTIRRFLAAPPEGTPAEILEAFDFKGHKTCLPPKLFLATVEQAPVAISITDPAATILYVNALFEELTGYCRDEVIGKNEAVLSSRATPAAVYQDLWQTIKARKVWRGHLVNHRQNGAEYLAELTISPVLDGAGNISYFLGMHRDISELHQLEQRLKFQTALTQAALDAAPVVVAMLGAQRQVMLQNQAYRQLAREFRGIEPAHLFLDGLERELNADVNCLCSGGGNFSNIEIRLDPPHNAAPRWFSCSGVRVEELSDAAQAYFHPNASRCYLLLVANDITAARQRIQEARTNLIRASMAEQQMNQTMREAISAAMFKLQAPLNIIKAALAMPSANGEHSSFQLVLKQALATGEDAMASLQHALPVPVREQSATVNLNELLHEVLKLSTSALLANGIVVDWRPAPVLPPLLGQANGLRGLFKYLLDNAIEAVKSVRDYREIRLQTTLEDDELLVEIMDNGPGIDRHDRLKIFEPFFCGWHNPKGHAGMGLTMAREIVLDHSGSIDMDADFLGGCRVCVRLPLAGGEASYE